MQIRKLKKLVTVLSVIFILSSCNKDLIVPDPPSPPPPPPVPGQISYALEIQPIFTAECVSCHGEGQVPPILTEGKSYVSLKNMPDMIIVSAPANSILYRKMATGGSMAPYCTQANADSVFKWISQGAKNN
jgi:hypothetical protein